MTFHNLTICDSKAAEITLIQEWGMLCSVEKRGIYLIYLIAFELHTLKVG